MSAPVPGNWTDSLKHQTLCLAKAWQISPVDGSTPFRFTDHDSVLNLPFETIFLEFSPVGGFDPTATEYNLGLSEHNQEFRGPVDATNASDVVVGPTYDDLRGRRLHEAEVDEYLVDWRAPWAGALQTQRFWITDIEFDNETFNASAEGLVRWMKPRIGDVYTRNCRWDVGRDQFGNISTTRGCRFNISTKTFGGTISSITTQRLTFVISGAAALEADDAFNLGRLQWLTGDNTGFISQVSRWNNTTNVMTLVAKTPYDLTAGDQFSAEWGCDKTSDHCDTKFSNLINFGGQLFVPGTDRTLQVPGR